MSNFRLGVIAVAACLLTVTWFIDDSVTFFNADQLQMANRGSNWISRFGAEDNIEELGEASTSSPQFLKQFEDFEEPEANSTNSTEASAFAVMGATSNPIYLFPLPITVLSWRRVGVDSLVCFAGSEESFTGNAATKVVLDFLKDLRVQFIYLDSKKAPLHTISQTCRMYIASSPEIHISDKSILVTTDSDIWGFHKDNHVPKPEYKMHLYNSECCGMTYKPDKPSNKFRMYPMTSMGMSAALWMDIMNVTRGWLKNGDVLAERLYEEFNVPYIRDGTGKPAISASWYADQILTSEKIDFWIRRSPENRKLISKTQRVMGRIDRAYWSGDKAGIDLSQHMDSHILHPLHDANNWKRTVPLLKVMLGDEEMIRLHEYWQKFTKAITQPTTPPN